MSVPLSFMNMNNIGDYLDAYLRLQKVIFNCFGYIEDWKVIPIEDRREMFWKIVGGEGGGDIVYHQTEDAVINESGNYYQDTIYTQRFLNKWVYRADGFTMICVDTHTDGNKFLAIYDNKKEIK